MAFPLRIQYNFFYVKQEKDQVCIITNLFGSLVSERISKSSSLDKKKKRGKYSLFFSKYSFSPCKRINEIISNKTKNKSRYKHIN